MRQSDWMGSDPSRKTTFSVTARHVAICTVGELFGGVERHVLGLIEGLGTQGVSTLLVLFHDGELAIQARRQGIEPVILPNRNRSFLTTSRQLARILEQHQIHIVHVHGYKATVFCALARKWRPFAMVKTEHGMPEPMAGGAINTWRNQLYHLLDSIATRTTGPTVCYVTEDLQKYYRRAHSGLSTIVIPNGVGSMDRRKFSRPAEMHEEWFNLLVVGRLDMVKGHHLAIEAMAAEGISSKVHLHIVGLGPREQELQVLAKSLGVAHRVHFLGFQRNVYNYIVHCNALLMPSLHEGLPYTLLEAMALGTPIIASRVGGLAEVLQDDVTALLVPPQDVVSLALAIARLHNDQGLCSRLGEEGRNLQQTKYSLKVMTESYLAIYRALLGKDG
jgi:glycosyltransferase involved in cell wall biosynthesis